MEMIYYRDFKKLPCHHWARYLELKTFISTAFKSLAPEAPNTAQAAHIEYTHTHDTCTHIHPCTQWIFLHVFHVLLFSCAKVEHGFLSSVLFSLDSIVAFMVVSLVSHFTTERWLQYKNVIFYLEILQSIIIIVMILMIRVVSCIWYSIFFLYQRCFGVVLAWQQCIGKGSWWVSILICVQIKLCLSHDGFII